MTIPGILLGLVVALLTGALFHAVRGGSGWRLLLHFGLSVFGFAFGQAAGMWFEVVFYSFGVLDLGIGIVGSLLCLVAGTWLVRG